MADNKRKQDHLTIETMARLLSGDLEQEELLSQVFPHLLARCSECADVHAQILRLQQETGHWDEKVAVFEGREAPALLAELEGRPFDEQLAVVRDDPRFQTWGLCQLLMREGFEAGFDDPGRAVNFAELAVRIAELLVGEAYDVEWVLDLKARSWAHLGNARRILGELWSAESAFREADRFLAESGSGNLRVAAEVLDLKASLRRSQRRLDEGIALADQAIHLYLELEEPHLVGRSLVQKAKLVEERGEMESAIGLLEEAAGLIDTQREPRLFFYASHNLLAVLIAAGRIEEAASLLSHVRKLSEELGNPLDRVRLRWAEGRIAHGLGQRGPAEAAFREVQTEFLDRHMGYDAALAALDLAALYAENGCTADLKRLAAEILPVFESREVHREAMAALLLFQHACQEERLTAELARQLASFLRRERRLPLYPFRVSEPS